MRKYVAWISIFMLFFVLADPASAFLFGKDKETKEIEAKARKILENAVFISMSTKLDVNVPELSYNKRKKTLTATICLGDINNKYMPLGGAGFFGDRYGKAQWYLFNRIYDLYNKIPQLELCCFLIRFPGYVRKDNFETEAVWKDSFYIEFSRKTYEKFDWEQKLKGHALYIAADKCEVFDD